MNRRLGMPARISLTGRLFGRYTILEYLGRKAYLCRCQCGVTKIVRASSLVSGRTVSCGCYNREKERLTASDKVAVAGRFWAKVDVRGNNDCWNWKGSVSTWGYGQFGTHWTGKRKNWKAHRFAYMLINGEPPPSDLFLCHKCDNKLCVNPRHMFLGTTQDNTKDCVQKMRHAKGESCGHAKLSASDVREIRTTAQTTSGYGRRRRGVVPDLARRYGVTVSNIYHIISGKTWLSDS